MVVAAQYDRGADFAAGDGLVHGQRDFRAAFGVGIEDACLRTHDEFVFASLAYPEDVVVQLALNLLWSGLAYFPHDFQRDAVGRREVFRPARCTYPAERAEAVVEEHRAHDVLYVGGIAETLAVRCHAVGTGAGGFEQEGVAVVEEVHAFGRQLVDGGYLPATPVRVYGTLRAVRPSSGSTLRR